jgi:hypothetical protein
MMPDRFDLDTWNNLGNVLLRRGSIDSGQLKRLVATQKIRENRMIGQLAVDLHFCTEAEIEEALEEQGLYRVPPPDPAFKAAHDRIEMALQKVEEAADGLTRERTTRSLMTLDVFPA